MSQEQYSKVPGELTHAMSAYMPEWDWDWYNSPCTHSPHSMHLKSNEYDPSPNHRR